MDPITQQVVLATAGAAAAGEGLYVDDVFSTFLYEGTDSTQTINNGIDLSGEGGLVWIKRRDYAYSNVLFDTERGVYNRLYSNSNAAESSNTATLTAFNSNGFSIGDNSFVNSGPTDPSGPGAHVSWTFRKAPGFFDVVTWTGDGVNGRQIAHNLGSTPGMSIIKCRSTSQRDWIVRHENMGSGKVCFMNSTSAELDNPGGYQTHSSTHLTLNSGSSGLLGINNSGDTYVAYVFANNDQSFGATGNEAIIKCGSYTGNGSTTGPAIDLGFEPQFVLLRCLLRTGGHGGGWYLLDSMRGIFTGERDNTLQTQESNGEDGYGNNPGNAADIDLTPTGFQLTTDANSTNESGRTYIYMAIRRPHKPPTAGTEVFAIDTLGGTSPTPPGFNSGFPVDMGWFVNTASPGVIACTRLQGAKDLLPYLTNSEDSQSNRKFDYQNGWLDVNAVNSGYYSWMFRRAPGFFDVVTYTGTGSLSGVNHNLGVTPELKIIKRRSGTGQWVTGGTAVAGENGYFYLDSNDALHSNSGYWSGGDDSATKFSVKNGHLYSDSSGSTYVAHLFATLDGISKVGSYSGGSGSVDVDCGFTAGARFVLIKRTDNTGDWYVWDTARGIVSGNDPYLLLNSNAAEVTNTDYIDPLNAGFTVTSSAPAALNTSGGTYLFLAIA